MNILGIETSCDETAAAVVRDGHAVLSSIVYTQIAHHRPYGGVVPEIASRQHVEHLPEVISEAVQQSGVGWDGIDAIAVTRGPGLATSLLVGLSAAKGLALRLNKPLLGINHLEGHLYSIFLDNPTLRGELLGCSVDKLLGGESQREQLLGNQARDELPQQLNNPTIQQPFLTLIVSGGHTCFIQVEGIGQYRQIGRTVDDAAGEAFDKGAKLLGLGYPGGPAIDKAARTGSMEFVTFPRGFVRKLHARLPDLNPKLCVSFSGLKTALLYHIKDHPLGSGPEGDVANLAASFQEAIVDTLVQRAMHATETAKIMAVVGGVSLNSRLREKLAAMAERRRWQLVLALPQYCTDNAAMIAGVAFHKWAERQPLHEAMAMDVDPNWGIGDDGLHH